MLKKERPVRLRAYQAGLWGCLTIPGRVGGLVGSVYAFYSVAFSSYQNSIYSESCRQDAGFFRSGALLAGRTRGAFFGLQPSRIHPGASSRPPSVAVSLSSRRLPPRVGNRTGRIPEVLPTWTKNLCAVPGSISRILPFTGVSRKSENLSHFITYMLRSKRLSQKETSP